MNISSYSTAAVCFHCCFSHVYTLTSFLPPSSPHALYWCTITATCMYSTSLNPIDDQEPSLNASFFLQSLQSRRQLQTTLASQKNCYVNHKITFNSNSLQLLGNSIPSCASRDRGKFYISPFYIPPSLERKTSSGLKPEEYVERWNG